MKEVILQSISKSGESVRAIFLPENGMNLKSLRVGSIEVFDQSTMNLFMERMAGLGALIGPHFYHRNPPIPFSDEKIFPHLKAVKASKSTEPFSHGIGRYVPWHWKATDTMIEGHISGNDTIAGISFASLEGFHFSMYFKASLTHNGIEIEMRVESERVPSIAGLHYYYSIAGRKGFVKMACNGLYNDMGLYKPIPKEWQGRDQFHLSFNLDNESDYTFWPTSLDQAGFYSGDVLLETATHNLHIHYKTDSEESGCQLYHPLNASYVCIEPVTAKNPRDAKQQQNHLTARIEVLCK